MSYYADNYVARLRARTLVAQERELDERENKRLGDLRPFVARSMARAIRRESENPGTASRPLRGEIVYDGGSDTYRMIGDADDSTPIATPFPAVREKEAREFREAEAEFAADCVAETGVAVSPEEYERQQLDRAEIRKQSHVLAHMLESAGTVAYRDDAFQLWIWHVHSLHAEKIPNFRRICLLPYIAAMVRASKLAALEFFLDRNPFCRFWTFTSGARCGIYEVGKRVSDLAARLNALNKELKRRFGVEIVFRSTELGTLERRADGTIDGGAGTVERDERGNVKFHVHAHCVVNSLVGFITPARWDEMIRFVWSFWGDHWDAGGMIRNARECCKYVTKPGDMLKLTPALLAVLEHQLHGKRLVTPMGTLKREIANRKAANKVLRRKRTREGIIWREVFSHNAHAKNDEARREEIFRLHQAERVEQMDAAKWEHVGTPRKAQRDLQTCAVYARLAPAVGPKRVKEPRVIVGGTHLCRRTINNHPLVSRLWSETVEQWEAGLRLAAISVHTGTTTGERVEPFDFMHDLPERCEPHSPPIFADN